MHSLLESAEGSCRDIKRAESAESASDYDLKRLRETSLTAYRGSCTPSWKVQRDHVRDIKQSSELVKLDFVKVLRS